MNQYGLIGHPLTHSFSKKYFEGRLSYELYDCITPQLFIENMPCNLSGFNVTIPHKQSIIPFLDDLSLEASVIGAVNCVRVDNGKLIGYNTDAYGFEQSIVSMLKTNRPSALIFGNGGVTRAVTYVLNKLNISYNIVSRQGELSYNNLSDELIINSHLLINCTPIGTYPNITDTLPINTDLITPCHYVYDLIYNPYETQLLNLSLKQGAYCKNGLEMLHLQAEKSFDIWHS